jgi:hypothetical protein
MKNGATHYWSLDKLRWAINLFFELFHFFYFDFKKICNEKKTSSKAALDLS